MGAARPVVDGAAARAPLVRNAAAPSPSGSERQTIPGRRYYPVRELDVRPGIKTHTEPEYPESAVQGALSGKVVIRLYIDESGTVERITVLRADPPGIFERSAERAFAQARFTPGMKDGRPVPVQMTLEVEFETLQRQQGSAIPRSAEVAAIPLTQAQRAWQALRSG